MENKSLIPTVDELNSYQLIAKKASESQFFNKVGGEGGLLSIMLFARELGLPPLQCLFGGMNNIAGKIEISPRMMNTMIRKAGHKLEIIQSDDNLCKIRGIRHDTKEDYICTFSLDDARRAGLVRSGGGWEKYASDMLFARCISRLARRLFADVISTAYVEGEIDRDELEAPQSTIFSKPDTISVQAEKIQPEPKEEYPDLTMDEFCIAIRGKTDLEFFGLNIEAFLYEISSKKDGKPVPIQRVMQQALKMPERFVKSYQEWYSSQEKDSETE